MPTVCRTITAFAPSQLFNLRRSWICSVQTILSCTSSKRLKKKTEWQTYTKIAVIHWLITSCKTMHRLDTSDRHNYWSAINQSIEIHLYSIQHDHDHLSVLHELSSQKQKKTWKIEIIHNIKMFNPEKEQSTCVPVFCSKNQRSKVKVTERQKWRIQRTCLHWLLMAAIDAPAVRRVGWLKRPLQPMSNYFRPILDLFCSRCLNRLATRRVIAYMPTSFLA